MDIIQIDIPVTSQQQSEVIIAELSEIKFHGFQEADNMLSAFIEEGFFTECTLQCALSRFNLNYTIKLITESNWNEQWEKEFSPVIVDSFVAVRAEFHSPIKNVEHEIIITPKMSFGTGHHATTYLMVKQMRRIDFRNKRVLDFGTGTGLLAILAAKLGAHSITAIDNDDWSIANARENFYLNNCNNILLQKNNSIAGSGAFDIILANINLNTIVANAPNLKESSHPGTQLLLSGFLLSDEKELNETFLRNSFINKLTERLDGWLSIHFFRQNV